MSKELAAVGKLPRRLDGAAKVDGSALYVDDLPHEGWHGVTVRSPHPCARILTIESGEAAALPNTVVITAADIRGPNVVKLIEEDWPVLAADRVDYVAQAVALVASDTLENARRAAELVTVTYDVETPVLNLDDALANDAGPKVLARCDVNHGAVDDAWEEADVIVEGIYETGHQEHIYIETNGMIGAVHDDGTIEVQGSMQCPYYIHKALTHIFGLPDEKIRVHQSVTGGGFGGKEDFPDMIAAHVALLAQACGHPVKMIYERQEDIVATTKRHPSRVWHKTGLKKDGTLVAMDIGVVLDAGAYVTLSPVVLSRAVLHAAGAYVCPNVRIRGRALATNTAPNGAFRGFGAPQSLYAVERQIDKAARALGMDPLSIRRKNAYKLGDVTPTGQRLEESVSAHICLDAVAKRSKFLEKWKAFEAKRSERADDGSPWGGIGLSLFWHGAGFTGNGERRMLAEASLRLLADGAVQVLAASTDIGQGTETIFPQIVAEMSGIPQERIRCHVPDTAEVPDSGPTVASRTVMVVGGVLSSAARSLQKALCDFVAAEEGVDPSEVRLQGGLFSGANGRELCGYSEIARRYVEKHGVCEFLGKFEPGSDDAGFDESTYRGDAYSAYGWGCDVVEVEVDPDTFSVRPTKVTVACDVGKAIHPILCRGQIEGGTLQAVAYGYLEEMKMRDGHYLNDRLTNYIIPTSQDAPEFETIIVENPTKGGPFGAKGVGELPMDGGAPAVVAAIENATGFELPDIPATPERIMKAWDRGHFVADYPGEKTE
jgi:CO/xanthine dehydrogenase Mo-binding subunit